MFELRLFGLFVLTIVSVPCFCLACLICIPLEWIGRWASSCPDGWWVVLTWLRRSWAALVVPESELD